MPDKLDEIKIPIPCLTDWGEMVGDDRVRYCAECQKNVYNLSEMTRREAEALIATQRGGFCARFVRNPDGAILTRSFPVSATTTARRASPVAAAVVTAIIGISPNVAAHTSSMMNDAKTSYAMGALKTGGEGSAPVQHQEIPVQMLELVQLNIAMHNTIVSQGRIARTSMIPLRQLYERSDLVVVARASKSVKVQTDGRAKLMKTRLQISSTHKVAERPRAVDLYRWEYGQEDGTYSTGGKLLLFLKREPLRRAGSKPGYALVDSIRGVKELSEADLQIWLQRIDDLASMTSKGSPEREEIVEWLVRCLEHPATRGDAVWDIDRSADDLGLDEEVEEEEEEPADESSSEDVEEESESGAEEEAEEEAAEPEPDKVVTRKKLFARLLTAEQQERLTQAVFKAEKFTEDDAELIVLVKHWGDGRLLPFLLSHLRPMEENPLRVATGIIGSIADLLDDKEVMKAYYRYFMNASYDDEYGTESEREEARQNRTRMVREFIALVESKLQK